MDRLGADGVRQLLGTGRKDESGDFTKGALLSEDAIEHILKMVSWQDYRSNKRSSNTGIDIESVVYSGTPENVEARSEATNEEVIRLLELAFGFNKTASTGIHELNEIARLTRSAEYDETRIRLDPSVVRGLEYYTGPVYEVELTFPMEGDDGKPVRFGSVGAGGRYDGLVARLKGQDVPATGFSIGVSRLQAALTHLGKLDAKPEPGPVVVTVFDRERVADYQRMVSSLRNAGIRAELYLGNPNNFRNQLKYADKRNAPCVVIQGGDEKAKGEVQIKDLIVGAEIADMTTDRDEYLEKQAQAQFAVPEDKLVDAVRDVLARHGIGATSRGA
jgi:histidyl-tRNA synthetase